MTDRVFGTRVEGMTFEAKKGKVCIALYDAASLTTGPDQARVLATRLIEAAAEAEKQQKQEGSQ